jgi:anhydro-N-acetylmuramic acid kinase
MSRHLEYLLDVGRSPERTIVGLISGTSADAIDAAVCSIAGLEDQVTVNLVHFIEFPYDPDVRSRVLEPARLDVRAVAELHVRVGELFAEAAQAVTRSAGLTEAEIDAIGSHGQTVYHHSGVAGATRATIQLGDGDVIAERTGLPVLSDFRARDIAAGGEGAPLSPLGDMMLFAPDASTRRVILNLGGIANITVLDPDPTRTFGFDTGPANSPLDRLARRITSGALDRDHDGLIGRSGDIDHSLLNTLLENDAFLARRPPKSTGFEMYGDAFVASAGRMHGSFDADLMATLTEFIAATIARSIARFVGGEPPVMEIIAAGGGASNPFLMERISARVAPIRVRRSEEFGVSSAAREAMLFAILADMALRGQAAWLPAVTGAKRPAVLGKLSFP